MRSGNPRHLSEQLPNIIGQSDIVDYMHARTPDIDFTSADVIMLRSLKTVFSHDVTAAANRPFPSYRVPLF